MKLVLLHGAPATGKYTIGRALAALTGFELYHNHLVVDAVLQRHAFGSPGFVAGRDRAWREHISAAAADPARRLIFTFNSENTVPQAFIDWLFGELGQRGVHLHSVGLTLAEPILEARLDSDQRRKFKKLTDVSFYRELRAAGTFASPVIPRTDLTLDTAALEPAAAARRIAEKFDLLVRDDGQRRAQA